MKRVLFSTDALDDRVRRILVDTLYTQPASLAIGAMCGIATSAVAAQAANEIHITAAAIALSVIGVCRVLIAHALPHLKERNARQLERLFEIGAFSYALLVGVIAALCIHYDAPHIAQMLTLSNAIGFAVAIAARNAGP